MADKSPGDQSQQSKTVTVQNDRGRPQQSGTQTKRGPLISLDIVDAADQRLWSFAAFVLVQAFKLADLTTSSSSSTGSSSSSSTISGALDWTSSSPAAFNLRLAQWVAIDCVFVLCVSRLRIPRLDWGLNGVVVAGLLLAFVDWILFGQWTLTPSMLLPTFVKSAVMTYLSTAEQSTRLTTVRGSDKAHLGGQFTVHILAVSTALLNPIPSTSYCIPTAATTPEPVMIPFIVNNTSPTRLTYSISKLDGPSDKQLVTVPVSELKRHRKHHLIHSPNIEGSNSDDEGLPSWAIVPSSPSPSSTPRHRLPHDDVRDPSLPFHLASTETLYYLPVSKPGRVRLESVTDQDGNAVRIRRSRAPVTSLGSASTQQASRTSDADVFVYPCPRAGFQTVKYPSEAHMCVANGLSGSISLELAVSGQEPLSVKWKSLRDGDSRQRTEGLDGITLGPDSTADAVVNVPMNVSVTQSGRTTYVLDKVVDGVGNEVSFSQLLPDGDRSSLDSSAHEGTVARHGLGHHKQRASSQLLPQTVVSRSVVVHRPPEIAFIGQCGRGQDVKLLHRGRATLEMKLSGIEQELRTSGAQTYRAAVKFTPDAASPSTNEWQREVTSTSQIVRMVVDEPGTYEIVRVESKWCQGLVLVPNLCNVVLQPQPNLVTTFEPLYDVCKSEVGAVAALHLTGVPPFVVHYELVQHTPNGPRRSARRKSISSSRDEIRLEPGPGDWEYRFVSIEDQYYKDVKLPQGDEQFSLRQTVQLVSDAQWRNAKQKRVVHACEGETFTAEVELKGAGPWELEYSILGQPKQRVSNIKKSPLAIEINIPKPISERGGLFSLSLESIKDAHGCTRPLTMASDMLVEVQRTKPTARFHGLDGARTAVIKDQGTAKIPLRLTGNGPWTITYQPPSFEPESTDLPPPQQFVAREPNVNLEIAHARPGTYRLVSVRDEFCPGEVKETDWQVETLPKPTLRATDDVGTLVRNGSLVRLPVCQDTNDQVHFAFRGQAPFHATYTLSKDNGKTSDRHSLSSINPRATLQLFTARPGHHVYEFTGVGDSLYSRADSTGLVAPDGGRTGVLRVEHDVLPLPLATFAYTASHSPLHSSKSTSSRTDPTPSFCVSDTLSKSHTHDDLIVRFEGSPPFELELEVRESGQRSGRTFKIKDIQKHEWHVDLDYQLRLPVPHTISLVKVSDANGCQRSLSDSVGGSNVAAPLPPGSRTFLTFPVAEIASIAAVTATKDVCVGDFLEFVVQGSPPFTVKYEFNGKKHTVPLQSSKFSRLAAEPGEFKILTVGHGQDQCRANNVNLVKHVHPIPTASVSTGDSFVVDLREGEQTEIVFGFTGTPPFSFTYSRRRPQDRYKDKTVLETHTVTGITDDTYTIMTSEEGTWSVSYVSDKFCSYPSSSSSSGSSASHLYQEVLGSSVKRSAVKHGDGADGTRGLGVKGLLERIVGGSARKQPVAEGTVIKA
ncbi:hypothetical protein OIO90_004917 [Microbotryomycetes sp. JL221]|nr:hypothetical protein OIO90_004917 [Microbotryomycetes sp. JL221]